ncbi:MAG TPA: CocE/NonD family hydrolase [Acetobacteraceae bacterium]|nr:CocE/NonD family hydrolase [Acetobacteraceae bacterium]
MSEGAVREIENTWIPLSDGTRLAARLWLPADPAPVPAILEYLPYRKRDGTYDRDALTHPWFAAHGYAGVRVDLRGSGESDGLLRDEYSAQELADALEVIAWIACQDWCSGAVGMMGISWGGFNALQVAALRPPALRAIITLCSTDDRYADDVHYMGGTLLTSNFGWGSVLTAILAIPPDPATVGARWREMWRARLEAMPLFAATWLRHPHRDAYWRHGSVCEDWDAIACPVFAVGGWTDAYKNAIPRLLANLRVPRQGLIGPWAHKYPHFGVPGPAVGFLQEALRWWDRWLKGRGDGGAVPLLRAWMLESVCPAPMYEERPGRWIAEPSWPPSATTPRRLFLSGGRLSDEAGEGPPAAVRTPQSLGATGGNWCPFGLTPDDADDQRGDDALSVVWDSAPLDDRVEVLGAPELELEIACDAPQANLIARLCAVHPDGASLRVSYGVLNLAHRDGHAAPAPLATGRRYTARLQLNDVAFAFPRGHRIRLALSTTYWPIIWPAPHDATVTVSKGSLTLPTRAPRAEDDLVRLPPPDAAPAARKTVLREGASIRERGHDIGAGEQFWRAVETPSRVRIEAIGTEIEMQSRTEHRIRDDDPLSARMEMTRLLAVQRGTVETRTWLHATMRATATEFLLEATLEAFEGAELVCRRDWREAVRRDLV